MLELNIKDIYDTKYKKLINYAIESCDRISLVFRKEDELTTYIHNDIYLMFLHDIIYK